MLPKQKDRRFPRLDENTPFGYSRKCSMENIKMVTAVGLNAVFVPGSGQWDVRMKGPTSNVCGNKKNALRQTWIGVFFSSTRRKKNTFWVSRGVFNGKTLIVLRFIGLVLFLCRARGTCFAILFFSSPLRRRLLADSSLLLHRFFIKSSPDLHRFFVES